jgi:very-short-patch-repair endonuclease
MGDQMFHPSVWSLARAQHGVVSRRQLLALGFTPKAIKHRAAIGRLHRVYTGVYAVGRPELTQFGRWMAAILATGPGSALSHRSAAALWGIAKQKGDHIHVAVPSHLRRSSSREITIHRRNELSATTLRGIPLTTPADTLIDLATELTPDALEQAINDADKLDLIDPETLAGKVEGLRRPGVARLRATLDRHTPTDSPLEREFLAIVRRAGLPQPQTQVWLGSHRVDFFWPDLNLVVETDSLRYHRTPAQQASDRIRDQNHLAAGRRSLRFTRAQVRFDAPRVERILRTAHRAP